MDISQEELESLTDAFYRKVVQAYSGMNSLDKYIRKSVFIAI